MSDFISKKELYHKLGEAYNKGYLAWGANEIIKDILGVCDSVEKKGEGRPKGHWIGHREQCENLGVMPSGLGAFEWCSNCDWGIDVREWHKNHYNFCPNCGADMRGKE